MTAKPQMLIAIESFAIETGRHDDGTPIIEVLVAGVTKRRADHPSVKGREHLFEAMTEATPSA